MKRTKNVILIILLLAGSLELKAQVSIKNADTLFARQVYAKALPMYLKLIQKDSLKTDIALKIARIYRYQRDNQAAEIWYTKAQANLMENPIRMFELGEVLRANGKYDKAVAAYSEYRKKVPEDLNALKLMHFADSLSKLNKVSLKSLKSYVSPISKTNSKYADFSPWLIDNQVFFLSDRLPLDSAKAKKQQKPDLYLRTGKGFSSIYKQDLDQTLQQKRDSLLKGKAKTTPLNDTSFFSVLKKETNVGPFCVSAKSDTVFFSRVVPLNQLRDSVGRPIKITSDLSSNNELCYIVKRGGSWSAVQSFPFNQVLRYSLMHPALSSDGKRLYFASDKAGLGGFDIFYSDRLDNGRWSIPENAGSAVNTPGNELFPYIDVDNVLYFASSGHLGLGGLDLFATDLNQKDNLNANWKITHLPEPINSSADDFGFYVYQNLSTDEKYGFLSSNRIGGLGFDDLYSFYLNTVSSCPVEILIVDKQTKKPLEGVKASLKIQIPDSLSLKYSGQSGKVSFLIKDCLNLTVLLSKADYLPLTDSLLLSNGKTSYVFEMEHVKGYLVEGRIRDAETGKEIDSATVQLNVNKSVFKKIQTRSDGNYSSELGRGIKYTILARKKGYFTKRSVAVNTADKPEGTVFNVDFELEKVVMNKEIKIENIYYDFAKATLRKESLPELDKIRDMLVDNPELMVEMSAHTDSRGNDAANMILSQKRAASVVKYLLSKGVAAGQLIPRGYGESRLVNQCANGVKCTEAEHELNRRTEFKVIGYVKSLPVKKKTTVNAKPKVSLKKRK